MSMKERLARALKEARIENFPISGGRGPRLDADLVLVEAILQALREPSVEMLVAALPNVEEPTDADKRLAAGAFNVLSPDRVDRAWQAINAGSELARDWRNMIDHIINEGK